jgi:hypothetical protein
MLLQGIEAVVAVLERIDQITTETPPVQQPSRFGNPAFRTWHTRLTEVGHLSPFSTAFQQRLLQTNVHADCISF